MCGPGSGVIALYLETHSMPLPLPPLTSMSVYPCLTFVAPSATIRFKTMKRNDPWLFSDNFPCHSYAGKLNVLYNVWY